MSIRHHLLSHRPGSACGVAVISTQDRPLPTVVINELANNPGVPVEEAYPEAAQKVCRAFLKGASPDKVEWVYRCVRDGREALFHVRLNRSCSVRAWRFLDDLEQLVGSRFRAGALTIPNTLPLAGMLESLKE